MAFEVGLSLAVGAVLLGECPANVEYGKAAWLKAWNEVCHGGVGYPELVVMESKTLTKRML